MDAERSGRRSLVLDAAYCGLTGSILVATRRRLATVLGVPAAFLGTAGAVTVGWAALVWRLSGRQEWRRPVGVVASANAIAAAGLLLAAVRHEHRSAKILLAAVATEVAGFSVAQSLALRRADSAES